MKLKLLTAIAALVASSGVWAEDTSVRLLCTFDDGTDSIESYPLTNFDLVITNEAESDAHSYNCTEWAQVDSDSISWQQWCIYGNKQCAGQLKTSLGHKYDNRFVEINRKTGSITERLEETTSHCWAAHYPEGIPDKESTTEKVGSCRLASEVENKF